MEIAFCSFVSVSSYGGIEVRMAEMTRLLTRQGHKVAVYATPFSHGGRKVEPENFMPNIPYQEAWRHKVKADVAYIYYYSPLVWRTLFSVDCPKIAAMHPAGIIFRSSPRHWLFRIAGSQDLASFEAVRIQSPIFKFEHNQVFQIPDWVDTKAFAQQQQEAGKFTLLFVGRHHGERRWRTFHKVASRLKNQGYDFDFVATGEGDELIRGLGEVNHDVMPEVYSRAHILLQPSMTDTFGLAIIEALSCGIPVITTPIPAHIGLEVPLFYAQSTDKFVEQVLKVYDRWCYEPEQYEKLRSSLRQGVLKYDVDSVFPQLENMFESVANESARVRAE